LRSGGKRKGGSGSRTGEVDPILDTTDETQER
jgi:hypothetical protein